MAIPKNSCSCHLFSLFTVCKETFLQVMPLLKQKIVEDISYRQQDRQSESSMPEQIAGMGRTGLRNGALNHGLCTERVFRTEYCAVR